MRATHNGACQVCGSFQAVHPKTNRLAKHGYTTRWGFFSGTCPGSDQLPWELSCDLIREYREKALAQVEALEAEIAKLTSDFSGNEAWVQRYTKPAFNGRKRVPGYYTWVKVALEVETKTYTRNLGKSIDGSDIAGETVSFDVIVYQMADETGKTERKEVTLYGAEKTIENAVRHLNAQRAFALQKEVTQRRMYIQWQQERLDSWKPQPLTQERGAA